MASIFLMKIMRFKNIEVCPVCRANVGTPLEGNGTHE